VLPCLHPGQCPQSLNVLYRPRCSRSQNHNAATCVRSSSDHKLRLTAVLSGCIYSSAVASVSILIPLSYFGPFNFVFSPKTSIYNVRIYPSPFATPILPSSVSIYGPCKVLRPSYGTSKWTMKGVYVIKSYTSSIIN
jgi:hypothetical protein